MFSLFSTNCFCVGSLFNNVGDNSNDLVGDGEIGRIGDRGSCRRVKGFGVGLIGEIVVLKGGLVGAGSVGAGSNIREGGRRVRFRESFIFFIVLLLFG